MTFYTDQELAALFKDDESHLVERKRTSGDRSAIRRNITAFANDLPATGKPGVIFIGVDDDGTCAEIEVDEELLRTLAQMRSNENILPFPSMTVEKKIIEGCEVAVVQVAPTTHPPLRYEGRVWIKVGPTVQLATPEEEQRLVERRRAGDLPFDMRPAMGASMNDLDIEYIKAAYLPAAVAQDILEQNRRPLVQQLHSLRFLTDGAPTWGALIAFGQDPQFWRPGAYVQFLRIAGTSLTDPITSHKELTGQLEDVLRRLRDLIDTNISESIDITSAARESRQPDYPLEALRQLANNAVMHRSYENTNAPARVYWFDDRIEIQNPGGLYGNVNPQNIHSGVTDYRNPLIAEIMHHLGFAQRFGLGIQLAKEWLKRNGNPPPAFEFSANRVAVTVRPVL